LFSISGVEQLFFLGGLAIAVGIFTYGYNVMETVGTDLYKISPITGFVVVLAEFLVLTLFTSQTLESFLLKNNLPSFPLVPLSTTQAFIGAVLGVGLAKDPLSINFKVLGRIAIGWGVAPVSAGLITFISLFFIQNVFEQKVIHPVPYEISASVISKINEEGIDTKKLNDLIGKRYFNTKVFRNELLDRKKFTNNELFLIFNYAIVDSFKVDSMLVLKKLDMSKFSIDQINEIKILHGKSFSHKIDFEEAVFKSNNQWKMTGEKLADRHLEEKMLLIEELFRIDTNKKYKIE